MFQICSNIVKNIEVNVFFKTSLKNRIVEKSEHCPPLSGYLGMYIISRSCFMDKSINDSQWILISDSLQKNPENLVNIFGISSIHFYAYSAL